VARSPERPLRVLVVGSGPAGRRHVRNALLLGHDTALARRAGRETAGLATDLGVDVFAGLDQAASWEPDAVVAADPPSAHLTTARWAVERGCRALVEKPLAPSPEGVDALLAAAAAGGVRLEVAYNLRFHPALQAIARAIGSGRIGRLLSARAEVGSYLPDWHPELDHRAASPGRADLGGGAALTLAHELDLVLWIAGEVADARGFAASRSSLGIDTDDTAELVLRHTSGALSSVHVDLVDRSHHRGSRWVGDTGTLAWELGGPVTATTAAGTETVWDDPSFELAATYEAELAAFLGDEPFPGDRPLDDARRALELLAAIERV
jgi:predicted dehydrogenase